MIMKFLVALRARGPWVLTAIEPDGPATTITAHNMQEVEDFVKKYNGKKNLYYSVNPTHEEVTKKASKKDIAAIEYLLADLDPEKDENSEIAKDRYLKALQGFQIPATAIIDSGNGIQVLWKLKTPIVLPAGEDNTALIEKIESRSGAAMKALGCEDISTRNIDRILRLPGTVNLPNARKRKAGRVECETSLIVFNSNKYNLEDFPELEVEKSAGDKRQKANGGGANGGERALPKNLETILCIADNGAGNPCGAYASRSDALFGFIRAAYSAGIDDADILDVLLDEHYSGCGVYEHIKENGGGRYARGQILHAANEEIVPRGAKSNKRIVIRLKSGERHNAVKMTEQALIKAERPVYVRGGSLVEPIWRWEKTAEDNRDTLVSSFVKMNISRLSYMTANWAVAYQKYSGSERKWRVVDPPKDVIETLLDLGHWAFDTVKGIINAPTMRRDGSIITEPGYDKSTQLWYKPGADFELPKIAQRPRREEAEEALETLRELISGFPFESEVSESVALAGIMTPVLRGAFDHAPAFLLSAPESGTGKTYLVTTISIIASGRPPMAVVGCANKEEMEKRLSAAAFAAMPILSLNNLSFDLESDLLNQMVTEGHVGIRQFGRNDQIVSCDCRGTTIYINGNNITIVGDMVRRTLVIHLDAKMENPEERKFTFDPIDAVKSDRGKMLAAIFTIVRAYMNSGERPDVTAFNGFDGWSRMVRYPLIWLGMPDPVETTKESRSLDPQRQTVRALIEECGNIFGTSNEFQSSDIFQKVQERVPTGINGAYQFLPRYPRLQEALGPERNVSVRSIGKLLNKYVGKISGGYRLERIQSSAHGHVYSILGDPPKSAQSEEM